MFDIKTIKIIYSKRFTILIVLFWFCQLFGSDDMPSESTPLGYPMLFNHLVKTGTISAMYLSILLLSFYLVLNFNKYYSLKNFRLSFLIISIIVVVLVFVNPNNNFMNLSSFFFGREQKSFVTYIIFLYSLLFLERTKLVLVLKRFLDVGLPMTAILCIYSLFNFIIGNGANFSGQNSTLIQTDQLIWIAVFELISLIFYLVTSKSKYLIMSVLFGLTIILSFRRYSLWISVISIILLLILELYYSRTFKKKRNVFFLAFSLIIIVVVFQETNLIDFDYYSRRYFSVFSYFLPGTSTEVFMNDSGHIEQSLNVTGAFIDNFFVFWGSGVKESYMHSTNTLYGASQGGIHNSYIFVWMRYGLFMLFYLLLILFITFYEIISTSLSKSFSRKNKLIKIGVLLFFLVYQIASWSPATVTYLLIDTIAFGQFLFLFSFIKLDNSCLDLLVSDKN